MTANKNVDSSSSSSQGDGGASAAAASAPPPPPPPGAAQPVNLSSPDGNTVLKSGPLFISSKGIGWTSWKKRWFILKRTSLVFFRSDPSAAPPKGGEVNLTLGGIDLNNSGSVVVKPDKKLLTVLFPDGRAFTLKAETLEDLNDWKTALENALAQAPTAALGMGQNGILKNEQADGTNVSSEKSTEKQPTKSLVIGRPILLALEEVDGSPSFLEKALRFIEEHGVKVEGILRQAADVDDVEHRIREFEQGKTEFSPEEDAHVIGDCVKYFLRELPSSPVPASCCNALLEACRNDRGNRVNAMRAAILETFPEPNRCLLQRILLMMQAVASHKAENRMSNSAVAACMAPLLLRPLLAGDCEIETDVNVGGDGSLQLLKAAAAANHAQAIVITLLDEYEKIFSEGAMTPGLYSDSEDCDSEDEEYTDDDEYYEDDENDDGTQESDVYTDDDLDASTGTYSRSGDSCEDDHLSDNKGSDDASYRSRSPKVDSDSKIEQKPSSSSVQTSVPQNDDVERNENILVQRSSSLAAPINVSGGPLKDACEGILDNNSDSPTPLTCMRKSTTLSNGPMHGSRRATVWGRTPAKKNLSMESIDLPFQDEVEIEKLEGTKIELQNRINEEVKTNAVLQANLEQRRKALHERRLALEQDVLRLQEQLQKEKEKRAALEAGLYSSRGPLSIPVTMDEKTKADLMEMSQAEADITNLKQKADNLSVQLNQPREQKYGSMQDLSNQPLDTNNQVKRKDKQKDKPKDTEVSVSVTGKSASKDTCMDGAPSENEKKHESTSGSKKQTANKKQLDPARSGNSRSISSNSKRSSSRNEGTNSTISALTKLTTRLNFLKERRSQIASELQNPDKGKASPQAARNPEKGGGSESHQSIRTTDEMQGAEVHSVQNSEKGSGPEGSQSLQIPNKASGAEGQSQQDSERSRNLNSESLKNQDEEKNQEQQPQNLNKGRSEGPVSSDADKVKGSGGRPAAPSWTNSR